MSKRTIELPSDCLKLGMYVARLDRPWTDTPFLFQGFTIDSIEELEQLRELCKTVYVEVRDGETLPDRKSLRAAAPPKPKEKPKVEHLSIVNLPPVKDPVPLRQELSAAREIHANAKEVINDMMDRVRKGKQLSVPQLGVVVDSMVESVARNREAITWLARMKTKDDYVYSHSLASSVWALVLGRHLGLDKDLLKALSLGAMIFDVGKTRLPTELLTNPSKLTPKEMEEVRRHVEHGLDIVRESGVDPRVVEMVATHHERFDGSGYPGALTGDSIPLLGRIAAIVDCYDAMTSMRNYAKPMSTYDAVRQLKSLSHRWFEPQIVEQFIQAVGVFPTGTLVELNTGEVGVVVGQSRVRRLRPELMLILDENKQLRANFDIIDLQNFDSGESKDGAADLGSRQKLWIVRGLEPGAYGIDPTEYFL